MRTPKTQRQKRHPASDTSYAELKAITDEVYATGNPGWSHKILALLEKHGIRPRQKDGALHRVTFSIAKSQTETFVVGLRYQKRDSTFTEDTFIFIPGKPIEGPCRTQIEKLLPEYKDTHKFQPR